MHVQPDLPFLLLVVRRLVHLGRVLRVRLLAVRVRLLLLVFAFPDAKIRLELMKVYAKDDTRSTSVNC